MAFSEQKLLLHIVILIVGLSCASSRHCDRRKYYCNYSMCRVKSCPRYYDPRLVHAHSSYCIQSRHSRGCPNSNCCFNSRKQCVCRKSCAKKTKPTTPEPLVTINRKLKIPSTTAKTLRITIPPATRAPTTIQPTTSAFVSLCSDDNDNNGFRILNGRPVQNECVYAGIASITMPQGDTNDKKGVRCHAVYTSRFVGKVKKDTFITTDLCLRLIKASIDNDVEIAINIGEKTYPLTPSMFKFEKGLGDTAYLQPKPVYESLFDSFGKCQKSGCAYDRFNPLMPNLGGFKDCKVASYGVIDEFTEEQTGLNEVDVKFTRGRCKLSAIGNLCLTAKSGMQAICDMDLAAPLYCTAPSNGERIFMGLVKATSCDSANPSFEVIQIPA